MSEPVTMPLVPVPIREVLALHPGITSKQAAGLLGWNEKTTAARLGKLAMYRLIDHADTRPTTYRLKDEANA